MARCLPRWLAVPEMKTLRVWLWLNCMTSSTIPPLRSQLCRLIRRTFFRRAGWNGAVVTENRLSSALRLESLHEEDLRHRIMTTKARIASGLGVLEGYISQLPNALSGSSANDETALAIALHAESEMSAVGKSFLLLSRTEAQLANHLAAERAAAR